MSGMAPNNRRCMSSRGDAARDVCSKEEQALVTSMWENVSMKRDGKMVDHEGGEVR